jgi:hypothetical protein
VRYWIHWNELVQGPFEVDELVNLHCFHEDLMVCMEDRLEWLPASRVADLAPAVDLWRTRRRPPPPPPPPPSLPPVLEPLQGEFFVEPEGQQSLFEGPASPTDNKGPFAFRPASEPFVIESGDPLPPAYTSPIRFKPGISNAPATAVQTIVAPAPAPAVEVPPPLPEAAAPASVEPLLPEVTPEPPVELPPAPPSRESLRSRLRRLTKRDIQVTPPPAIPETPAPLEPIEPAAPAEPPYVPPSFGNTLPEQVVEDIPDTPAQPWVIEMPVEAASADVRSLPPLEIPEPARSRRAGLLPWIAGVAAALLLVSGGLYWLMDHLSSASAISEALPPPKEVVKAVPLPTPAPVHVAPPVIEKPMPPAPKSKPVVVEKPSKPVLKKSPPPAKKVAVRAAEKPAPRPAPVVVREPEPKVVLPGLAPTEEPAPPAPVAAAPAAPKPEAVDQWIGRQADAIKAVMGQKIMGGKRSIGDHAKMMLNAMHAKEVLHAAETGERLYLPDKMNWLALREEGSKYRVYLNFSALQATGERSQTRSYQFAIDLADSKIHSDDSATQQDFLNATPTSLPPHNPMANEIDSLLGGVDLMNKHKLRLVMAKRGRSTKTEMKAIEANVAAAQARMHRAIVYFRMRYPEKALQNVAKAYNFVAILKGDVK